MLKKVILLLLILLSSNFVIAASDKNDAFYKVQMAYYNSIKTCSAGTFNLPSIEMFGQNIDFRLIVYGKKNGKCIIREQMGGSDTRCSLPMDVARKYADENIRTLETSMRQGSAYSAYVNQVHNNENYCKF